MATPTNAQTPIAPVLFNNSSQPVIPSNAGAPAFPGEPNLRLPTGVLPVVPETAVGVKTVQANPPVEFYKQPPPQQVVYVQGASQGMYPMQQTPKAEPLPAKTSILTWILLALAGIAAIVSAILLFLYLTNGGPEGSKGITGPTGPKGPEGLGGVNGLNGDDVDTGATGPQGPSDTPDFFDSITVIDDTLTDPSPYPSHFAILRGPGSGQSLPTSQTVTINSSSYANPIVVGNSISVNNGTFNILRKGIYYASASASVNGTTTDRRKLFRLASTDGNIFVHTSYISNTTGPMTVAGIFYAKQGDVIYLTCLQDSSQTLTFSVPDTYKFEIIRLA